jgi:hypothetical protein
MAGMPGVVALPGCAAAGNGSTMQRDRARDLADFEAAQEVVQDSRTTFLIGRRQGGFPSARRWPDIPQ